MGNTFGITTGDHRGLLVYLPCLIKDLTKTLDVLEWESWGVETQEIKSLKMRIKGLKLRLDTGELYEPLF